MDKSELVAFQSNIFPEATVKGYVQKHSPDGVTLREEGIFPQTPNTLNMLYDFGSFKLNVQSSKYGAVSISTTDLFSEHMWDERVREVYSSIDAKIQDIIPDVQHDPEYQAFNRNIMAQKPINSQWFRTNIAYPDFSGDIDETRMKDYIESIPYVEKQGQLKIHDALELSLEEGLKMIFVKTPLGIDLNFVANQIHSQKQLEKIISDFNPESKGWSNNPTNENTRGTDFYFGFASSYFRLPFMFFEDDVKELKVVEFGKEVPYI